MDTRMIKIRKLILLVLAAAVLLAITVLDVQPALAAGNDAKNDEEKPELTIEVVEDIPASDIEEQAVPLAESPDTAAAAGMRRTVIIWTLAAAAIAYAVFVLSGMKIRKSRRQMRASAAGPRSDGTGGGGSDPAHHAGQLQCLGKIGGLHRPAVDLHHRG